LVSSRRVSVFKTPTYSQIKKGMRGRCPIDVCTTESLIYKFEDQLDQVDEAAAGMAASGAGAISVAADELAGASGNTTGAEFGASGAPRSLRFLTNVWRASSDVSLSAKV
jgi:hypothetical protein